ncbi:MAG: oligopeptide/dipeptide ABC transporter ATP-binding protein [Halieaceae bacterium]|jgi:oligopeptide/dipeptide ABC transporter ATP-binding protein
MSQVPVLQITDLCVEFATFGGAVKAVRGVSYQVQQGETLAVVGESGSGKSVTVQTVMGLIHCPPGRVTSGSAKFMGRELLGLSSVELNKIRGAEIGMIFQDPMTSLNPTMKIGDQIAETLIVHRNMGRSQALAEARRLLDRTRIPEAAERAQQYPFEFSGGMLQRVMIAISLACKPKLLIADEPTTALDVTIQAQVLELMEEIQREDGMSIILITHDLAVVARMADQVAVMYAGEVVESGPVDDIFYRGAHPYTVGLQQAMPDARHEKGRQLNAIPGSPPDLFAPPSGCGYHPRCPHAMQLCSQHSPPNFDMVEGHWSRCWLQHPTARAGKETGE